MVCVVLTPYNGEIISWKQWIQNGFFQFEIIINILVSFSRAIWIPMVHSSITNLLSTWYGIDGIALYWFVSYLSDRKQRVKLIDCLSSPAEVACGVPQGSVLGPFLLTLYTTPLSYVIQRHNVKHHLYADDTQIYLSLSLKNPDISLTVLTKCLQDVSSWLSSRKLKLNPDKTDFLLIRSKVQREFFF